MFQPKYDRGAYFENVAPFASESDQHAMFTHMVHNLIGLNWVRGTVSLINIYTQQES